MAQNREYAYFLKGNKIAVVERDWRFGSGQTLGVPGINDVGQQGATYWKSPTENSTLGLEIEYSYSPNYFITSASNVAVGLNKHYVNGWIVVDGYLTFIRGYGTGSANWTTYPENSVTSGSQGDTGGQTQDYIVVRGSKRWNGLHKIQSAGTNGELQTYTKVKNPPVSFRSQQIDFNTDEEIFDGGGGTLFLAEHFLAGDYVWTSNCSDVRNNGLFKVSSVTKDASTPASSKVKVDVRYYSEDKATSSDTSLSSAGDLSTERTKTAVFVADDDQSDINVHKAERDFCYILTDVDVLNDEGDEIDVPSYLSKALVCYVKARLAEDQMNMEAKEYYMRMFREKLEKHDTSRVWGKKAMMPSRSAIR
tara:strand:+ start:1698 stop:2789 length:1092 start_codon:yes stop_codon:yes gene_type:complete